MSSASESFKTVRELIKQQRYDEARALLRNLEHPVARSWLESLEGLGTGESGKRRWLRWWMVAVVIVFVLVGVVVYLIHNTNLRNIAVDARTTLGVIGRPAALQEECDRRGYTEEECEAWILQQGIEEAREPSNVSPNNSQPIILPVTPRP
jgi:hypothetical protein